MSLPSARDILVAKGLAKPGRGRFSKDAKDFLATLTAGVDYAEATATPARPAAPVSAAAVESRPVREARERAAARAAAVAALDAATVADDADDDAEPEADEPVTVAPTRAPNPLDVARAMRPAAPVVRQETVAFGLYRDGQDNPPVLAIQSCGKCSQAIRRCACQDGPRLPRYAGGGVAYLRRSDVK